MNSNAHYFLRNDVKNKRSSENRFQSFRRPFIFSGKPSLPSAQYGGVDIFLDAGGNSIGTLAAEGIAAEQPLFGRVGQEGGFNEDGRDVGRAQDGEVGFVNAAFVELVEFAQFGQDGMSQFAAVAHGGGLGHVENGMQ